MTGADIAPAPAVPRPQAAPRGAAGILAAVTAADALSAHLSLGGLLDQLRLGYGGYQILDHWQQGEFHHDLVLRVKDPAAGVPPLPGAVLVVATNCNGGVKELLCFSSPPTAGALWHARCPAEPEFAGELPPLLESARTMHWFDPGELLSPDARSEYRPEFRERQPGGGWRCRLDRGGAAAPGAAPGEPPTPR